MTEPVANPLEEILRRMEFRYNRVHRHCPPECARATAPFADPGVNWAESELDKAALGGDSRRLARCIRQYYELFTAIGGFTPCPDHPG